MSASKYVINVKGKIIWGAGGKLSVVGGSGFCRYGWCVASKLSFFFLIFEKVGKWAI